MDDILVIGAGPGGCATAIAAALRGLTVSLIAREEDGIAYQPGETLHPGIEPIFLQLGVWPEVLERDWIRHEGHWVALGSAPRFQAFGVDPDGTPLRGFHSDRRELNRILLARAVGVGACLLSCRRVRDILRDDTGAVIGVELTDGQRRMARFVVDATGGGHAVARRLGARFERCSPRMIARYGHLYGSCQERDAAPLFRMDDDRNGWTWTARVAKDVYAWTRLRIGGETVGNPPEEFAALCPLGPVRGADVTWRCADNAAGAGWFLAGDAAYMLDPASSHGVLQALMSGIMIAHCVAAVTTNALTAPDAARSYDRWIADRFAADVGRLRALYAFRAWEISA